MGRRKKKLPMPEIQECPANAICREKNVSCDVCMELSAPVWAEHVRKVLGLDACGSQTSIGGTC